VSKPHPDSRPNIQITLTGHIYARAIRLAHSQNQVVGEKNDYYVTLAQLEDILQGVNPSSNCKPSAPPR
jgi:hypothetical protein